MTKHLKNVKNMTTQTSIDAFTKNFNVNTDLTDVKFQKLKTEPYQNVQKDKFGEKKCVLYKCVITVYNIDFTMKILSFVYENYCEVLKLEITIHNELLSREIASCRNFLQRKRNMNLVFEVLIKFAKLYEMRRLICCTVFQKLNNVIAIEDENGVVVKCCNEDFSVKYLELCWTISWSIENYAVSDFVEFYCSHLALQSEHGENIKKNLQMLARPNSDFHSKLKLWKLLMGDLYGYESGQNSNLNKTSDVLEIDDSDSEESVIEINDSICAVNDEILVLE